MRVRGARRDALSQDVGRQGASRLFQSQMRGVEKVVGFLGQASGELFDRARISNLALQFAEKDCEGRQLGEPVAKMGDVGKGGFADQR